MKVLFLVDHAVGISGPHRNVVGALNALSAQPDVDLRLLTGKIDENEPYAKCCEIQFGFEPHKCSKLLHNLWLLRHAVKGQDLIYVPTGLKSFLYAFVAKGKRKLVAGPNVTPLPLPNSQDSPGWAELHMADRWFEASNFRREYVVKHTGIQTIGCVHHAIDIHKFSPEKVDHQIWERFHVPLDSLKVLYVGNDYFCKGVPELAGAIELINKQNRDISNQLSFIFAGNLSEENKKRLQKLDNT